MTIGLVSCEWALDTDGRWGLMKMETQQATHAAGAADALARAR